jgi:uridine phosphorylase
MILHDSELILKPDGSIYHLNLLPEDIAPIIITVGDLTRVERVSKHFDRIELKKIYREFSTHTGYIGNKRLTVISTGIGPDNIDIVINELDALVNIDLKKRIPKEKHTPLIFVRIGTSGSLQDDIPLDSFLKSTYAIGLDNLLSFYTEFDHADEYMLEELKNLPGFIKTNPYLTAGDEELLSRIGQNYYQGITVTCPGFYGPQGRQLRLKSYLHGKMDAWSFWEYNGHRITNFEMETAAIYGLASLAGHRAISLNAIIANRKKGTFSSDYLACMDRLIVNALEDIVKLEE